MIRLKPFYYAVLFLLLSLFSALDTALAQQPATDNDPDFSRIHEFAALANIAYHSETDLSAKVLPNGYSLSSYQTIPRLEVAYLIATHAETGDQVIAVRGTHNAENAIVDISLKLQPDKKAGVKLHNGFAVTARNIYAQLKGTLDKEKPIHTTGHSLGGAVALILGMYLDVDGFKMGDIITFGQPKVSNIEGSKTYQHLKHLRIVTPLDLVPLVPLFDPLDINNLDIYWHGGTELLVNSDQTYSLLEGIDSMLRATRFTQRMVDEQNLDNHRMALYLELVENKVSDSTLVPFKNSFNIFNWFGGK
jgi:hypothetical protein